MFTILILSGYPGNQIPSAPFFGFDKVVHVAIYLILSLLIMFGIEIPNNKKLKNLPIKVILFGISFGGFMEICQNYIFINRSGNWYDFTANTIGAILGVLVYPIIAKSIPFKR